MFRLPSQRTNAFVFLYITSPGLIKCQSVCSICTHLNEIAKNTPERYYKVVSNADVSPPWQQSEDPTLPDTLLNPAASALMPAVKRAKASAKWHVSHFVCLEPSIPHGLSLFTAFVWKAVKRRGLRAPAGSLTYVYGCLEAMRKEHPPTPPPLPPPPPPPASALAAW